MDHFLQILMVTSAVTALQTDYISIRENFTNTERFMSLGGMLTLSEKEQRVNEILMKKKISEIQKFIDHRLAYPASQHYFDVISEIEVSQVFQFIRKMPKGANLNSHLSSMLPAETLLEMIARDVLVCINENHYTLSFTNYTFDKCGILDKAQNMGRTYQNVFKPMLSLYYDQSDTADYYDIASINLEKLKTSTTSVDSLLKNVRFLEDYVHEALRILYDDNVMYLELRWPLSDISEQFTTFTIIDAVKILEIITNKFVADHPDFLGVKVILTSPREILNSSYSITNAIESVKKLRQIAPDLIVGFDIWGGDYMQISNDDFIQFTTLKNITELFFRAGQTNWIGVDDDLNIIDAVLLECTRISNGFSILRHPKVLKIVKDRNIPIEVSPIFDQVIGFIRDLRNHPGVYLLANNYPVVITNDFPMLVNSEGLSYNWYMAFMGMTYIDDDLKFLKQLAINSLVYSTYSNKTYALERWKLKWNKFLDDILQNSD